MAASMKACRKYLLHFAHEHLEFRLPEVKSIASLFDFNVNVVDFNPQSPFLEVGLPSEECARKLMSRSTLVKSIYELWTQASNYEELCTNLHALPATLTEPYTGKDSSFRIIVDSFNKRVSNSDKIKKIECVTSGHIDFQGKLNLSSPDHSFHLLEYYGPQQRNPPDDPFMVYFGRWIVGGRREDIGKYHLQTRKFIGNTSMDAGLALIMANMGQVKPKSLVFDPFVGTGSLLVSCAHFGAYVMGTDLDYNIIHGQGRASRAGQKWRGPDENIRSNLRQYGLEHLYLDALVADASRHSLWRPQPLFDSIITDPPYGIREPTRKVGTKKKEVLVADEYKDGHIPSRVDYQLSDILRDLLNFAATYLTLHGRLVYWLPVHRPDYSDDQIPQHPCFDMVANTEQALSTRIGRRLITMEKVKECKQEDILLGATVAADAYCGGNFRDKYFRATPRSRSPNSSPETLCVAAEGDHASPHGDETVDKIVEGVKNVAVSDTS